MIKPYDPYQEILDEISPVAVHVKSLTDITIDIHRDNLLTGADILGEWYNLTKRLLYGLYGIK